MSRLNLIEALRRQPALSPAIVALTVGMILLLLGCSGLCWAACAVENPVVPDATITVVDADTNQPVDDATVELLRGVRTVHGETLSVRQTEATDHDGVATFEQQEDKTHLAIQMHSPDEFFWLPCARREGYETVKLPRDDRLILEDYERQSSRWEVTLEMTPGESTPCKPRDGDEGDDGVDEPTREDEPEFDPDGEDPDSDEPETDQQTGSNSHDSRRTTYLTGF